MTTDKMERDDRRKGLRVMTVDGHRICAWPVVRVGSRGPRKRWEWEVRDKSMVQVAGGNERTLGMAMACAKAVVGERTA